MTNSKQKGKRGELEWCTFCKKYKFTVKRSVQYCGKTEESADCIGLPYLHQEIKRVESLNINKAYQQAKNDSKKELIPIVAHRKNKYKWLVTMSADDFFELYKMYDPYD